MRTLLVTRKMSPELAARVQASVEGRRAAPGARLAPRAISLLRLTAIVTILAAVTWLASSVRRVHVETESQRAALLERARRESAELGPSELDTPARVLPWLALTSGGYEGDVIADELRPAGAFQARLREPALYVRGPLGGFAGARVAETAAGSLKDAFVLCLMTPPEERTEKLLRARARAAFSSRGNGMQPTQNVERLHDALAGLPFLGRDWQGRVAQAGSRAELSDLGRDFDRAPIEAAKRAARATLLLFALDEPGAASGPTELDGERPHDVRVLIVDLRARKPLLRLRRHVDPSWTSAATRAEFASGVDGCALALEVHQAVAGGREVAAGK